VKKLVLIEDDPFFCVMLADLLTLEGFDVTTAGDTAQGLEQAIAVQPDFILCHAEASSCDGQLMLRQVRENVATAYIPFLLLDAKFYLDHRRFRSPLNGCHVRSKMAGETSLFNLLMSQLEETHMLPKAMMSHCQKVDQTFTTQSFQRS
jgi:CheY-like chemotaxis protein